MFFLLSSILDNLLEVNLEQNCEGDESVYNIDFTFKILYEYTQDILSRYEKENDIENISDKELGMELNRIKDLKY